MADSFDQFETLLREEISGFVVNGVLDTDDPAWALTQAFQPIAVAGRATDAAGSSNANTANWEASWRVRRQRGGRVTGGKPGGGTALTQMGTDTDLAMGQAVDELYLDPAHTAIRSYFAVKMLLRRIKGQLTLNRDQINAQLAAEPIEDVTAGFLEDATFQVRQFATAHWYSNGTGELAQFAESGVIYAAAGSVTASNAIALKTGTFARFVIGGRYVIAEITTDSTKWTQNGGIIRCVAIDNDNRKAWFQVEAGQGGDITIALNNSILVEGNVDFTQSTFVLQSRAPEGLESLIVNTGDFPGTGHDVTTKQELMGFVKGSETNKVAPTPEVIAELTDKITEINKRPPSVLIAEQSVWTYYNQLERAGSGAYVVPMGGQFMASGGVAGPNVGHGQTSFARLSSTQIRPGSIAGISPETWKKFIPLGDMTVKWLTSTGGQAGAPSVFRLVTSGRQATELLAADFDVYIQFGNTDPRRNWRRIGLTSQRDQS